MVRNDGVAMRYLFRQFSIEDVDIVKEQVFVVVYAPFLKGAVESFVLRKISRQTRRWQVRKPCRLYPHEKKRGAKTSVFAPALA